METYDGIFCIVGILGFLYCASSDPVEGGFRKAIANLAMRGAAIYFASAAIAKALQDFRSQF